jgi:hypothetical protein
MRRISMGLTPPKKWVFWSSLFLTIVGFMASLSRLAFLVDISVWLLLAGYVLLFLGNIFKGL